MRVDSELRINIYATVRCVGDVIPEELAPDISPWDLNHRRFYCVSDSLIENYCELKSQIPFSTM